MHTPTEMFRGLTLSSLAFGGKFLSHLKQDHSLGLFSELFSSISFYFSFSFSLSLRDGLT